MVGGERRRGKRIRARVAMTRERRGELAKRLRGRKIWNRAVVKVGKRAYSWDWIISEREGEKVAVSQHRKTVIIPRKWESKIDERHQPSGETPPRDNSQRDALSPR